LVEKAFDGYMPTGTGKMERPKPLKPLTNKAETSTKLQNETDNTPVEPAEQGAWERLATRAGKGSKAAPPDTQLFMI
jgi:hypothetical protein